MEIAFIAETISTFGDDQTYWTYWQHSRNAEIHSKVNQSINPMRTAFGAEQMACAWMDFIALVKLLWQQHEPCDR